MSKALFDADLEQLYDYYLQPNPGGVLSVEGLNDSRLSRKRLIKDADAVRWRVHWVIEDLISYREWAKRQADEAARLRRRVETLFGILTPEQRAFMRRHDDRLRRLAALREVSDEAPPLSRGA
jgi:hypothetical protein